MESSVIRVTGPNGENIAPRRHQEPAWARRLEETGTDSLRGFTVLALDGEAGRIDQVIYWREASRPDYLVVGTGRWPFRRKSVLPVEAISEIDIFSRQLRVGMSLEQIRQAPGMLPWI